MATLADMFEDEEDVSEKFTTRVVLAALQSCGQRRVDAVEQQTRSTSTAHTTVSARCTARANPHLPFLSIPSSLATESTTAVYGYGRARYEAPRLEAH